MNTLYLVVVTITYHDPYDDYGTSKEVTLVRTSSSLEEMKESLLSSMKERSEQDPYRGHQRIGVPIHFVLFIKITGRQSSQPLNIEEIDLGDLFPKNKLRDLINESGSSTILSYPDQGEKFKLNDELCCEYNSWIEEQNLIMKNNEFLQKEERYRLYQELKREFDESN